MYFQNPFATEFLGNWGLGDRQHSPTFKCPPNAGRGETVVYNHVDGPFNLSGNDPDGNATATLTIIFAHSVDLFKNWAALTINVQGSSPATTRTAEIVAALNADTTFASYFTAASQNGRVIIRQSFDSTRFRFYIQNGTAEYILRFNAKAGVAELPTYFMRHTVGDYRFTFDDAMNALVYLDPDNYDVDVDIIETAVDLRGEALNFDASVIQTDYELLHGRSGIFTFKKITVDGTDRITEIIEYPAGSVEGDLAKKTQYVYTDDNTNPDQITEIPYTLEAGDLVTPP